MQNTNSLLNLIKIDANKCLNCHRCIAVCPVKYCNNASDIEEGIEINSELCIACGECIKVCSHDARELVDDTEKFFNDLKNGVKISTLIAPAVNNNFPLEFGNLLSFLKEEGVKNNFDVSLGAEITTYKYFNYYKNNNNIPIIAQPCPCIVKYIEIYKPNLIKYLAPVNSPAINTAKWVRERKLSDKLAFIGPCIAKKMEFEDPNTEGLISYNITITGMKNYMKANNISLESYNIIDFDSVIKADKGMLYSKPGGLIESLKQYTVNAKTHQLRQIEGVEIYKKVFDEIEKEIEDGDCDIILLDILNCTHGCNRGTGTNYNELKTDDLLKAQNTRVTNNKKKYYREELDYKRLESFLKRFENIDLSRKYTDKSDLYKSLEEPTNEIIEVVNREMGKFKQSDIKNCCTCGYNSCRDMVKAIINGLYRPQQCHHFLESFYRKHSGDTE